MSDIHPISWLKLEQYHLEELSETERARIENHLNTCGECRACLEKITGHVHLKPLPAMRQESTSIFEGVFPGWGRALAGVAALLIVGLSALFYQSTRSEQQSPAGTGIKGADFNLILTLLRERDGQVVENPGAFRDGDRFSLRVTHTFERGVSVDAVVIQGAEVYFPIDTPEEVSPGNQIPIPGAFRLTGDAPVTVCVYPVTEEVTREAVEREKEAALPENAECRRVAPLRELSR